MNLRVPLVRLGLPFGIISFRVPQGLIGFLIIKSILHVVLETERVFSLVWVMYHEKNTIKENEVQ